MSIDKFGCEAVPDVLLEEGSKDVKRNDWGRFAGCTIDKSSGSASVK